MALIEDLNIKVKDKNANAAGYEDIRQLRVPRSDSGYGLYTNLTSLRSYIVKPAGEELWEVVEFALFSAGGMTAGNAAVAFFDEDSFTEELSYTLGNGKKRLAVVLTPKNLTIGEVYHVNNL